MRVLFFGNGRIGLDVARELATGADEVVGAVLHPPERARDVPAIVEALGLPPDRCLDGARLEEPAALDRIAALQAEIGVCALFGYLLRPALLALLPHGCLNVHPAYLPYNRGAHPNVWSIVEGTPAGVTVHWIDEGVDTGDVVLRHEVPVEPVDTAHSLYRKLEAASRPAFAEAWALVRSGCAPRIPQERAGGTSHRVRDLARLDEVDLERSYTGRELLDLLRARTFPPHRGAVACVDGRRVEVRVELRYVE